MPHQSTSHQPLPGQLCIHLYTYGHHYKRPLVLNYPVIKHVKCRNLTAPSSRLCDRYTGLDRILSDNFFSHSGNENFFRDEMASLDRRLYEHRGHSHCLAVAVACKMGMHRSVAMAERMATDLSKRGFTCYVTHLHLKESKEIIDAANKKAAEEKAARDKRENDRRRKENERLIEERPTGHRSARQSPASTSSPQGQLGVAPRPHHGQPATGNAARRQVTAATRTHRGQPVMENVEREQVQQYWGKPAIGDTAIYQFTPPIGWVPLSAQPV